MASGINPLGSSSGTQNQSSTSSTSSTNPNYEQTFLTLLVTQLKNQDPLNPTDSTQFVTQLAQFSELEQVIGIKQDIESYHTQATGSGTGTTNTSNSTNSNSSSQGIF